MQRRTVLSMIAGMALFLTASRPAVGSPIWWEDYTGNEANTLLLWKFDEPAATADSSGNGYTVSFTSEYTEVTAGKFGTAFHSMPVTTDPVTGYAATSGTSHGSVSGGTNAFSGTAFSMEFWFKPDRDGDPGNATAGSYLVDKRRTDDFGFVFRFNTGVRLTAALYNGRTDANVLRTLSVQSENNLTWSSETWYHLAVTYASDTGRMNMYRDGELIATNLNDEFGEIANNTRTWRLAGRQVATHGSVPGLYDNFRVSSVAYDFQPIPEPGAVALMVLGAFGLLRRRRG